MDTPVIQKKPKNVTVTRKISLIALFAILILTTKQNVYATSETDTFLGEDATENAEPIDYSEEDLKLLATLITAEAGGCDDEEQYRVGNVVINRMLDDSHNEFKKVNTIKKVIYQENQFNSVNGTAWNKGPTEIALEIAKELLEGKRVLPSNIVWFSKKQLFGEFYYKSSWHVFSGWPLPEEEED